jgi:uncharacterized membrane protein
LIIGIGLLLAVLSYFLPAQTGRGSNTPERCWKAGIFYVNHDDPVLFVEKRFGVGYTLNFGNRWSWAVLAVIVVLVLAPIIFAILSVLRIARMR